MNNRHVGLGAAAFIMAWVLFVLVDLAILAGVAYIVFHFVSKFW